MGLFTDFAGGIFSAELSESTRATTPDDTALPGTMAAYPSRSASITPLIETQLGFPCFGIGAVTLKTLLRQDWPDVAIERYPAVGWSVSAKGRQPAQGQQQ